MGEAKSKWDKADVILRPVGGLLTALAVAGVGLFGSQFLAQSQAIDANSRLYAELITKREEGDSLLRKDLFDSIIGTVVKPQAADYEQQVLSLELLSYNFHEAIDLGPLFKQVYKQINDSELPNAKEYLTRLERAARDATTRQIEALEEGGATLDGTIDFEELGQHPEGISVLGGKLKLLSDLPSNADPSLQEREFRVEALYPDLKRKEVRLKLEVRTSQKQTAGVSASDAEILDSVFWVGLFDLPMIENIRVSHSQRCAIVLRKFQEESAEITLIYFPGSRASLKDKLLYGEVVHDLLSAEKHLDEHKSK